MSWQNLVQEWLDYEGLDSSLRQELVEMSEENREEAFGADLSFGTAGMRGILGPGTNRMNIYTVRQATEGFAQLILKAGPEAMERGVAISYDNRHMSPEFAMEAAKVLGYHNIKSYVYESLRPTPVLSFAVRHLKTYGGIMITASHNPSEYNGYKVYGEDGGQMPPEDADNLTKYIRAVENPLTLPVGDEDELLANGTITMISDDVDQAYLEAIKSVTVNADLIQKHAEDVNIVYTPLHGTGYYIGSKAMEQAGFSNFHVVEEQATMDGDFPTVELPNPESVEAFTLAQKLGQELDADILMATDPDADRLGCMIKTKDGSYQMLTGNQIASLMIDYILAAMKENDALPDNGVVIKSMVSTHLADAIVAGYGVEMEEVLTGFKFIADRIKEYEQTGEKEFLMGFEESYGYLIKPFVRDKDAIQAMLVLGELTVYHKQAGRTLADALEEIYERCGYFYEKTISISFPGLSGKEKMAEIMADIRAQDLEEIAGLKVEKAADYLSCEAKLANGDVIKLDNPPANALKYTLENNNWVAFRPSGTEPKIKLYLGVQAPTMAEAEELGAKVEAAVREMTK